MSFTLSQSYFQSCSNEGNFVFIKGEITAGNFFAITSIADFDSSLTLNQVVFSSTPPTDLPAGFTSVVGSKGIYSYDGFREDGIKVLTQGGAIEKQILGQ